MMNATELQLRKVAFVLTGILLLQLLWSGLRLWQASEPDPIYPAEASLQVDGLLYGPYAEDELSHALVSRPLFWKGRNAYMPDLAEEIEAPAGARGSDAINQVTLQGVYTGAVPGIIISFDGERRRVRLGEYVEDWEFTELIPGGALFTSGNDRRELNLEHAFSVPKPFEDTGTVSEDGSVAGSKQLSSEHNETTGE